MKKAILAAFLLAGLILAVPYVVDRKAGAKGPVDWVGAALCDSC